LVFRRDAGKAGFHRHRRIRLEKQRAILNAYEAGAPAVVDRIRIEP
jgi:hypothetical protein